MTASGHSVPAKHPSRLRFAPVIAGVKRAVRQHPFLIAAAMVVLWGGGVAGGVVALNSVSGVRAAGPYLPGGLQFGTGPPRFAPYVSASLSGVSVASREAAWIVGSVAWRWNGRAWQRVPPPTVSNGGVAAVTPDDAWAVGARGDGSLVQSHAVVEHWDGGRWSAMRLPRLGASSYLFAVSAAGPRSVWAVGATFRANRRGRLNPWGTRPLLLHWNGTSLTRVALPWMRPGLELDKVVATSPSSVWVVSTGYQRYANWIPIVVEHWNGTRWRKVPAPFGAGDFISGFSASAGNDAWAVGSYAHGGNTAAKYSHSLAAHWDGQRWQITPVPNPPGSNNATLTNVAAVQPDDAWAIGLSQSLDLEGRDGFSASAPAGLLEHWDGRNWHYVPGAPKLIGRDGTEQSLAAAPDGSAWVIGSCGVDNVVARFTGGTWVTAPHPPDMHWRTGLPARQRSGGLPSCPSHG
jgi:hypothetical protein